VTRASILPADSDLYRQFRRAAVERRCVFFAGLPGVGKSLLLQQLALIAAEAGRQVHLLQWDVARGPFETPELLARFPETNGVTHPAIRKAVGVWARGAVAIWDERYADPAHLLIGELPLIGSRLIELARPRPDTVEPLLAGERSLFLIPVPSRAVRQAIEAARVREMAAPIHERERANAIPSLVQALWEEIAAVARELRIRPASDLADEESRSWPEQGGVARGEQETGSGARARPDVEQRREDGAASREGGFDPDVYAGVYLELLQCRRTELVQVTVRLPVQGSVYDLLDVASELVPSPADVQQVMAEVGARPEAEVEREVADWFRP
jgi:hypothetical protein